ncbi:MAG TPA: DUF3606 domain-containing protein [Caldimonas sp.]|nr:DUF3606 domain-containing protein [Caldimonas sp.]
MTHESDAAEDPSSEAMVDFASEASIVRWARALGTTDEALMSAIQAVGARVDRIKEYLGEGGDADEQIDG